MTRPAIPSKFEQLDRLRTLLQEMHWSQFEEMVPLLVGRMIHVRFVQARAGYQDGADAGTVGRSGRRLRIEAKRYTSKFDARDIIGGLRQAIAQDPSLECWIACATRDIPEQLASQLEAEGAGEGIPVLTIAWDNDDAPLLAALCTQDPEVVARYAGEEAGRVANALAPDLAAARDYLARELETWKIGFDELRAATHAQLSEIWCSKRAAKARFGQDVAAGDGRPVAERVEASRQFDLWWEGRALLDAPAAVVGQGGVGKTWAALGWIMGRLERLPIIVTIPAGSATPALGATVESLLRLIGGRLATITGVRDAEHWSARLRRVLARPSKEGPALCLLFDGINQNDGPPWLGLLQLLQDRPFSGRIRTVVTTRPQHFDAALGRTRSLVEPAEVVSVERFDDAPGGELDKMLAMHDLTRDDLHPDLLDFARVPRLFALITRLRDRLTDAGRVTTHRLLWEYGRDTQGERAGSSFSEADWQRWLSEVARNARDGLRSYTMTSLGQTAGRPDLEPSQVRARLSDIIDGNLTISGPGGTLQLSPDIVAHALGAALLEQLDDAAQNGRFVEGELEEWFDPIDGFEERAEVLRAATSIMAERDVSADPAVAAAVVTAWLQTQNLPVNHLNEIHRLAPRQIQPLLETIERSGMGPQASARALAVDALRSTTVDTVGYGLIVATFVKWFSRVSRDVNRRGQGFEQAEAARIARILERIGTDVSGTLTVAGYDIELQDDQDDELLCAAVTVLDGHNLVGATEVFARAALAMSIRGRQGVWEDLKWLCLLNEKDAKETAIRLRSLSADIAQRPAEAGIHSVLPRRVAALLLWLTGQEGDDDAAYAIAPRLDRPITYEDDYLANPGTSFFFRLERRHADAVLRDQNLPLERRLDRAADFLLDPSFEVPTSLADELMASADEVDVGKLTVDRYSGEDDLALEQIEVALARCAPDRLADLHRRKLAGYLDRPTVTFDSSAWSAEKAILLADEAASAGCRALRERSMAAGGGINENSASSLLIIEILDLPGVQQVTSILDMEPRYISTDFAAVLRPLSSDEVDRLLDMNADADPDRLNNLTRLLSVAPLSGLSNQAWEWLERSGLDPACCVRSCAFATLFRCDARRLADVLLREDWNWERDDQDDCRHYGSLAIAEADLSLPFEEIAPRIAPALLARAVRERGGAPAEARMAAAILDEAIMQPALQPPEPGSVLTVKSEFRRDYPMAVSITPGPISDADDPFAALAKTPEEFRDHSRRAVDTALARIRQARSDGASLYLSSVDARDLHPIVTQVPTLLDRWLEGASERSSDFRRRVHLAEGFYLALCEALLTLSPSTGATLWRALRESMATRFTGRGGVDERVLMLFRVAPNPEVLNLRAGLLDLAAADADERLLDVAIAAITYGCEPWLSGAIEQEARSELSWRRRRAVMLTGFQTGAALPVQSAILEGEEYTAEEERQAAAGRRLSRDAAARHWWRCFVEADNEVAAFAAWTLFRRTADRRSLAWLGHEVRLKRNADPLSWRKYQQLTLNDDDIVRVAGKREKDATRRLLDRTISRNVRPWYRSAALQ
ncbi:hypothetical protein [Rhizobium leguminosarum]|uniref:hypothetical protein n=1 Tax=Rhizobium leguminosarum TaxID=384 RepID=UPI001C900C43|nr:hypothetical protein [Rhizobium leguminosarum]MBY2935674.1 hypothetical protein [Rhizobium leguminosarum]